MSQLIIEYNINGSERERGYQFTTPTNGFDPDTIKTIWRNAMPRGQGWGDASFIGARSIKSFELDNGQIAVSEVTVTDLVDENGRKGIRRAEIDVMSKPVYAHHLRSRWLGYPTDIMAQAKDKYIRLQRNFPKLKKKMPLVLSYPFESIKDWWLIEALMLQLVLSPTHQMRKWGKIIPFTTLSLNHLGESKIVALPTHKAHNATNIVYI